MRVAMKTKHSKILNQKIIINDDGSIFCSDGTEYKKSEIELLQGISDSMKVSIHKIKKSLNGVLDVSSHTYPQ